MDNNKIDNTFSIRLKTAMKSIGLNQKQLAEKIGVTPQSISYYCNGARLPDVDILRLLANCLDVSADYLLGIERKNDNATQNMLIKQAQDELLDKIIEFCQNLKSE